jgi:starvation-inducible DNA-binding protein
MGENDRPPLRYGARISMPVEIRVFVIAMLNQTLASTVDLRSHVKQASWNVKGTEFLQLQALFASIATELDAFADLVAERIAVLGGAVQATVRTAARQSKLPEYPADLVDGTTHVRAVADRFADYASAIRADIVHATDVEDAGTANLYTDISREIETRLGELDAYLYR